MAFVGVEFPEESGANSIAVVSSLWLTPLKKEVFWPPFKLQQQFERAVKNHVAVEEDWKLYPITRCFFQCEEYEKARLKIKRAEVTSDVQSELEDASNTKRARNKPRRLSYGSSDEDSSVSSQFERPPPPIILRNITTKGRTPSDKFSTTSGNQDVSYRKLNFGTSPVPVLCSSSNTPSTSFSNIQVIEDVTSEAVNSAVFQKKLFSALFQIKEQNDKILALLNKEKATINHIPDNIPIQLPVSNDDNLNQLELYLKNKENATAMCSYLSTLGGRDITTKINRVMKTLMCDTVARAYSFYGKRNDKLPFCDLLLKQIVIDAIKRNSTNTYDKDIEDCVKVWLKHAPQRLKLQSAKRAHTSNT